MDKASEDRLRALRTQLAEIALSGDMDAMEKVLHNPAGDAFVTMMHSGLRQMPLTRADTAVAERCHRWLALASKPEEQACAFLGLTLFSFAYRFDRPFELIEIPTPLLESVVRAILAMPTFFTERGDRARALHYLENAMKEMERTARLVDEAPFRAALLGGVMQGFDLRSLYGEDVPLRAIAELRAALIRAWLSDQGLLLPTQAAQDASPLREGKAIRIGVLCPGAASEVAAIRTHLFGMDLPDFHLTGLIPQEAEAQMQADFADVMHDFTPLPTDDISTCAQMVRDAGFDVLMCGANLTNDCLFPWTLLMAQRLAPVQAAMHSCPVTTGFDTVDLFINGALNEPPDAHEDYREGLLLIDGAINHYAFPEDEQVAPAKLTRADIGVPPGATLLVSGANFFKIGPEMIDVWADIMAQAPNAHLLIYPFNPNWTTHYPHKDGFLAALERRFAAKGVSVDRLHVIDAQPDRSPILGVLALADVYLDSFPYSGAVSLMDPLSLGLPPVVLKGRFARCRQSAALLEDLGLDILVADSPLDYTAVASRICLDPAVRRDLRGAITRIWQETGAAERAAAASVQVADLLRLEVKSRGFWKGMDRRH